MQVCNNVCVCVCVGGLLLVLKIEEQHNSGLRVGVIWNVISVSQLSCMPYSVGRMRMVSVCLLRGLEHVPSAGSASIRPILDT